MKLTFLKHKEFITGIATLGLAPRQDNTDLIEVIDEWKKELNRLGSKVVIGDCGNCTNGWITAIKDVYIYGKQQGWLTEQITKIIVTETIQDVIKKKPKKNK